VRKETIKQVCNQLKKPGTGNKYKANGRGNQKTDSCRNIGLELPSLERGSLSGKHENIGMAAILCRAVCNGGDKQHLLPDA
jgi:hypothetical protein